MRDIQISCRFNDSPGSPREQLLAGITIGGVGGTTLVANWHGQDGGDGYFIRMTIFPAGLAWAHAFVNLPREQWYNDATEGIMLAQTQAQLAYTQMLIQQRIAERPVEQRRQEPWANRLILDASKATDVYTDDELEEFARRNTRG